MNKSKLTLIIDGNWLLMSRLSVIKEKYPDDVELCKELQLMMVKSINVVLRMFLNIDNIIFVSDGGSWRNEINSPNFITESYKGTREQDPNINWKMIFDSYENFIKLLKDNNITTCHTNGIEGDDWCWYWSKKLNEENTNCIIWSMDKDLTQLVHTNHDNGVFTVCWNSKTGVTLEDGDYSNDSDLDFFFGDLNKQNNDKYLHEIIRKSIKINKINPNLVVLDKIIRGDKGDNILPIILRKSKNGNSDKLFRVSTKDLDETIDVNNEDKVKNYIHNIINSTNYKNRVVKIENNEFKEKTENEILEHFKYNKKLVYLDENSFPQHILLSMKEHDTYNINKDISNVTSILTAKTNQISDVLDSI